MTQFIKPPTDNFYKFGTVASVVLAAVCILALGGLGALDEQQKRLLLWTGFALGSAGAIVSGYFWLTRTQRYQDIRERGDGALDGSAGPASETAPSTDERIQSTEDQEQESAKGVPEPENGLPELPAFYETTIQNGFGVIPHHYWAHYVNGKPVLEIWFHALNFGDTPVTVSLVSIPDFRVNSQSGSRPVVFEKQIHNATTGLRIGRRRYKLILIKHELTADRVEEFRNVKPLGDNNASLTIAVDGFRTPLPYVLSNVGINGTIHFPTSA